MQLLHNNYGLICNQTESVKLNMNINFKSIKQSHFSSDDEDLTLYKLLDSLKPWIVCGIIDGDTHRKKGSFGKYMISTQTHSGYINITYLLFKKGKKGKYHLDSHHIKMKVWYYHVIKLKFFQH